MNLKLSAAALALSLGFTAAASAAQFDLGPLVPGTDLTHSQSFSGALDDTFTFTLASNALEFRGNASSGVGPQGITDFSATLTGPNGYSAAWTYFVADLGGFGIPFIVESVNGHEATLAAGAYSLHITGTGVTNDGYFLRMGVPAVVPEPASAGMVLAGLAVLAAARGRRRAAVRG